MKCPSCGLANPQHNRYCRGCGAALGGAPAGESERRPATVLFADMTGFTAMSERMDPEEVHEIINIFLQELAACVQRYGGTIDKYIGDEIMAVFGAPRVHEDDPERALATALEMRESLHAVNRRLADRLPNPIGLHIGINTGLVIAGRVGDETRSEYTVLGDTVNLASRLGDQAEDGQIFVAETTWRLTKHAFEFREMPEPLRVKGKAEPVKVWELRRRRPRRESRRGLKNVNAPLVGREAELARLGGAVARLEEGAGGFVSLAGPAGVGKSRLLAETRVAAATRTIRWVEAACASLGLGGTLAVWADAMRRLKFPGSSAQRRSITTRLSSTTSMLAVGEARDATALLARMVLTEAEIAQLDGLDEDARRRSVFLAVRDAIEKEAARTPIVLVLDDLHWCDSASMRLLGSVLESTSRVPLLIITSFRGDAEVRAPLEEAVARAAPPSRLSIELQPLSPPDSAALAAALTNGSDPLLDKVRTLLVEYAEGNPLFLEEVLRSLEDQKVVQRDPDGTCHVSQEQERVDLPETLQGLLLDRIDRLPESSKRLVQIAAVIGRTFPAAMLGEIGGFGGDAVPLLTGLEQAGFFERSEGPAGADYRFRHELIREAAYSSLLHRHRRDYHRRVAEWYERQQVSDEPMPEIAPILALHWERAEEWTRADLWALRAAEEARRTFALDEATDFYVKALQFAMKVNDADVERRAEQGLGEISLAANSPAAAEHFTRALALAREPLDRAVLERRAGQALDRDGEYTQALAAFARAADILGDERPNESPEWAAERARLRVARAAAHLRRGDDELARSAAESALRAGLPPGDLADATVLLGAVALRRDDTDRALAHFGAALELAQSSGDLLRAAVALECLAAVEVQRRERDAARRNFGECLEVRSRLGDRAGCGTTLINLADLDEHAGALAPAAERLREAVDHAVKCDEPVIAAQAHLRLGRVLRALGRWAEARDAFVRAGRDDPEAAGRAALELALLAVARGERPEPQAALRQALEEGQRHGMADLAAHARLGLATIARRRGLREDARGYLREVLMAARGDDDETRSLALVGLAELLLDEGKAEVAVASGRLALESALHTGPAAVEWRARRKLGAALAAAGRREEGEEQLRIATEAARGAGAYPELARCLADWAAARAVDGGPPDPRAQAMLAEMRGILAYLAGGTLPPGGPPSPDGPGAVPPTPSPAPAGSGAAR